MKLCFDGTIVGIGTESGTRFVVGAWDESPFGPIVDVMVERPDGHRLLIAPSGEVATFVAGLYTFDEVRVEPTVLTRQGGTHIVTSTSLRLSFDAGRRTLVGRLLRLVPPPLARAAWWSHVTDAVARLVRPGVRTRGTAHGRAERYCALDEHVVRSASAVLDGVDQGSLRDIDPPVRFGFASAPRRPSVVRVTTIVS